MQIRLYVTPSFTSLPIALNLDSKFLQMVLDAGRIVEFGTPKELLMNEQGTLRSLVDESGDRDALYAMANKSAT